MTSQQLWKLAEFIYTWEQHDRIKASPNLKGPSWTRLPKLSKETYFDVALQVTLGKVPQDMVSDENLRVFYAVADFFLK